MINEYDSFHATVIEVGNSLMITIPSKTATFAGIKKGDQLKVMFRKKEYIEL